MGRYGRGEHIGGGHRVKSPARRDWLWIEEGLHCLPQGLHEEGCEVPRGQQQEWGGRRLQKEHQWCDEGSARIVQGPAILHWWVDGRRGHDRHVSVQGRQWGGEASPHVLQARSRRGKVLDRLHGTHFMRTRAPLS